jgi:hypothetical protein
MYLKKFDQGDLAMLSFGASKAVQECVKTALDAGKDVQWKYSSFSDPGGDYCAVLVDGVQVYRQEGY